MMSETKNTNTTERNMTTKVTAGHYSIKTNVASFTVKAYRAPRAPGGVAWMISIDGLWYDTARTLRRAKRICAAAI